MGGYSKIFQMAAWYQRNLQDSPSQVGQKSSLTVGEVLIKMVGNIIIIMIVLIVNGLVIW